MPKFGEIRQLFYRKILFQNIKKTTYRLIGIKDYKVELYVLNRKTLQRLQENRTPNCFCPDENYLFTVKVNYFTICFGSLINLFIGDTTKNVLTLWKNCPRAITSSSKVKIRLIISLLL